MLLSELYGRIGKILQDHKDGEVRIHGMKGDIDVYIRQIEGRPTNYQIDFKGTCSPFFYDSETGTIETVTEGGNHSFVPSLKPDIFW